MGLKDILKLVQSVADKYMIDKPYIVGGLPRDIYMKIPNVKTTDIDLTTNSPEVLRLGILLADELNVTFELSDDGHITVFSDEFDLDFSSHFVSDKVIEYLNGEHKGLEEAFSRDFTINTLHQDLVSGEILDPTGFGFKDIENKLIKTPVPAAITLMDDPRRAYRAINLAARYNFDIDADIKNFVIENAEVFSASKIKDKYIAVKINKALKTNEALTLKLLKEMKLFDDVPLSGYFKEVLIKNKILVDYLGDSALDNKFAFDISDWDQYASQGPAYKTLSDWWKQNARRMPGHRNPTYQDWNRWYMDKFRREWRGIHKNPEETLNIMKNEIDSKPDLFKGFRTRKQELYDLLTDTRDGGDRVPERAKNYQAIHEGKIFVKPGVNIENVTPATKSFIKEVAEVAQELGAQVPIITSGYRSIEEQVSLMAKNWSDNGGRRGGRNYLIDLYGRNYGGAMADIFEEYGRGPEALVLGIEVIRNQPTGSSHILNPGQALDFSLTTGIKKVLDTIKSRGRFDMKIVNESRMAGPHFHVSIRGENSRRAAIQLRKERLTKLSTY